MESNRRKSKRKRIARPRALAPKHLHRRAPLHLLRRTQRSNLPARRPGTSQPRPLRPPHPLPSPPLRRQPRSRRRSTAKISDPQPSASRTNIDPKFRALNRPVILSAANNLSLDPPCPPKIAELKFLRL